MRTGLLFCALLLTFPSFSQTVLISPSGDGGFQNGTSFAANGWTEANTTFGVNKWFLGTVPGGTQFPTRAAYVSWHPTGIYWTYDGNSVSVSHFYRDVTVPAGETDVTLSFNWQAGGGPIPSDAIMVSVAPTSYTPVGSTTGVPLWTDVLAPPAVTLGVYNFSGGVVLFTATLKIPVSFLNNCNGSSTFRLIFSWKNGGSGGSPGISAAIDNISLVSQALTRITSGGVYTIDQTLPNSGNNFTSFTDAVNALNAVNFGCITSPIELRVTSGQVFAENPPPLTVRATAATPVIFQKWGSGANPLITPNFGTEYGICIDGGDYITFDGVDITPMPGVNTNYGYFLRNASSVNGAQHNTIKNASISLNRTNSFSKGIFQVVNLQGSTQPTNATGANSYNRYYNLQVTNAATGIELSGYSGIPDLETEVGTLSPTVFNIIGDPATPGDISAEGVRTVFQKDGKVFNNAITNLSAPNNDAFGIYINGFLGAVSVYNNKISNITAANTVSEKRAVGLLVTSPPNSNHSIRIYNNIITGVNNLKVFTTGNAPQAIGMNLGNLSNYANQYYVDFNSVRMEASQLSGSSAALAITSGSTPPGCQFFIRNNLLANYTAAQAAPFKHLAFTSSATSIGAAGSVMSSNILYVPNDAGISGFIAEGDVGAPAPLYFSTVSSFESSFTQASGNMQNNPNFVSATDLHITAAYPAASNWASVAPWVTNDIDFDSRGTVADIGADQITNASPLPVNISAFSGRRMNGSSYLQWTTAGEQDNKGFDIEYASDGRIFRSIGFVASKAPAGNSPDPLTYNFVHPIQDGNLYYRLKQIDFNGGVHYSRVLKLTDKDVGFSVSIWPNPVIAGASVTIQSQSASMVSYVINDPSGRLVKKGKMFVEKGVNTLPFDTEVLPGGTYVMTIYTAAGRSVSVGFLKK